MAKYYYLKSTLPYLRFGKAPAVKVRSFLEECAKWMNSADMEAILGATLGDNDLREKEQKASLDWKKFDIALRREIADIRKDKRAEQGTKRAKYIIGQETPLDAEIAFEKNRWDHLEDREALYEFDINDLIIYFLKLQIAERLASFDKDEGEGVFYKLCEVKNGQTEG
ncbi:MAG: DUF2764 family protein [Candidatus Omnitrophota bacterium]|nr:DUF2764 domain-containing protein [Candidatus Omnitrophota bacterium]